MTVPSLPTLTKINSDVLKDLYLIKRFSVSKIAKQFKCSENRINYWLAKYNIKKRSISDAMYVHKNPLGDPFAIKQPKSLAEGILFGLGLGLYWGEGTKRGGGGMRITNTDVKMIKKYIEFLETFFAIPRSKLKFSLLIFRDIMEVDAINYWCRELNIKSSQFYKTMVLAIRGKGTYKYKSEQGVIIVQFNNVKLKRIICEMIENIT